MSDEVCVICLESMDLRTRGSCQHCCTGCITKLSLTEGDQNVCKPFTCPTCEVPCQIPTDSAEGFVSDSHKGGSLEKPHQSKITMEEKTAHRVNREFDVKCTFCRKEQAVVMCSSCDQLYLCTHCRSIHANNKVTGEHRVIELVMDVMTYELCKEHNRPLKSYCQTCKKVACCICVMAEHGDHVVESLCAVVETKRGRLKLLLTKHEETLKKFEEGRYQLSKMNELANDLDKGAAVLLEAIEKQGDKMMDAIVQWKKTAKSDVGEKFGITSEIHATFKDYTKFGEALPNSVLLASELVSDSGPRKDLLSQLCAAEDGLNNIEEAREFDGSVYAKSLRDLRMKNYTFFPEDVGSFGTVRSQPLEDKFDPKETSRYTIQCDSPISHISCLSMIDAEYYAAALFKRDSAAYERGPVYFIYIFELPHVLVQRFKVVCFLAMSGTPDGKLAVLSEESYDTMAIKVYNPTSNVCLSAIGIARFGRQEPDICVTPEYQFLILSWEGGEQGITVVNKYGGIVQKYAPPLEKERFWRNKPEITCGGRFVFVSGQNYVYIYEITSSGLKYKGGLSLENNPLKISSTPQDDFFIIRCKGGDFFRFYMMKFQKVGLFEWAPSKLKAIHKEGYLNITTRDGKTIVWSDNKTIKVFRA